MKVLILCLLTLLSSASWLAARAPLPINRKFNIGQDIITSDGYGLLNLDSPYLIKKDGKADLGLICSLSYGINRYLGFTLTIPFFLNNTNKPLVSRGLADISTIMQFHLYRTEDILLLCKAGLQYPTGDTNAHPALGSGSFNPLVNLEGYYSSDTFFVSGIIAANICTQRKHRRPSTVYDYEFTIGPKFPVRFTEDAYLYTFLELQGLYTTKGRFNGFPLQDTGGHLILFGPIISFDIRDCQYLLRLQLPVYDRRFGNQTKADYLIYLSFQKDI